MHSKFIMMETEVSAPISQLTIETEVFAPLYGTAQ